MKRKYRTAFLGSTRGTILKTILAAWESRSIPIEPVGIITDRADAPIRLRADEFNLPFYHISPKGKSREEFDRELSALLDSKNAEIVILAGFMRIVSPWFVQQWKGRVVNVHPSLLPRHAGLMDLAVHQAVLDAGETLTGCTLHLVDEVVDTGEILIQRKCPVLPEDTPETLKSKVQNLEVQAYMNLLSNPEEYLPELQNSSCINE